MTRTLVVSPYAPYRDGIANYAVQEVAALRAAGHDVEVCSPTPSAAQHHLPLGTPSGLLRLVALARGYDRVVVQWYPELLFSGCRHRRDRLAVWGLVRALAGVCDLELRVHEILYEAPADDPRLGVLARHALEAASAVTVHTEPEQARLTEAFGLAPGTVTLVDHGASFQRRTDTTPEEARAELGVPADAFVFLSIGFVQRHKGFDRGVRALRRLRGGPRPLRLYVVGDVRVDHPDLVGYRDELDGLVGATEGAEFRCGYVSDEEFDRWLVAADVVVLPYRQIWSSSVIERAGVYGVPVVVTDVGGLADQAAGLAHATVVADDDALAAAMAAACGAEVAPAEQADLDPVPTGRAAIQARIDAVAAPDATPALAVPALGPTPRAPAVSTKPGVGLVKKVLARLTGWQVDPVAVHVDEVVDALQRDVARLEARLAELEVRDGAADAGA